MFGGFLLSLRLGLSATSSASREPIRELGLNLSLLWFLENSSSTWSEGFRWYRAHRMTSTSITGLLQEHTNVCYPTVSAFHLSYSLNSSTHSFFLLLFLTHLLCTVTVLSCPSGSSTVRVRSLSITSTFSIFQPVFGDRYPEMSTMCVLLK